MSVAYGTTQLTWQTGGDKGRIHTVWYVTDGIGASRPVRCIYCDEPAPRVP